MLVLLNILVKLAVHTPTHHCN